MQKRKSLTKNNQKITSRTTGNIEDPSQKIVLLYERVASRKTNILCNGCASQDNFKVNQNTVSINSANRNGALADFLSISFFLLKGREQKTLGEGKAVGVVEFVT